LAGTLWRRGALTAAWQAAGPDADGLALLRAATRQHAGVALPEVPLLALEPPPRPSAQAPIAVTPTPIGPVARKPRTPAPKLPRRR